MVETIRFDPSCDLYLDFVQFLADDSGETSPDDIVLVSKVYPGVVHDVKSFCEWLAWREGRDAKDRILWVF